MPQAKKEEQKQENPFYSDITESTRTLSVIQHVTRPIFHRLLGLFFFLAIIPIAIYLLFGITIYVGHINGFLPEDVAVTVERALKTQVILTLFLVTIAVIFASSLLSRSLIRPLKRLLALTRIVSGGKLNYRLKVTSEDEIGELTEAFNVMIGRLNEQQKREHLISRLKTEFISIAAHQLRTPLSAVKWTFRMMLDGDMGKLHQQQIEFLQRGYDTNENMIRLVNDLLNVARIEEGRFGFEFTPTDFASYIKRFIELYAHQAESRKTILHYSVIDTTLPPISIDKSKMDLVFQNLLDNAVKYSNPNGTIEITLGKHKNYAEVTIADHGVGIPKYQMDRAFSKFFRGDNVIRMQTQGSGLGLFIVRNIIRNHGGNISIASEENNGTKVRFTLPLLKSLVPQKEKAFEEFISSV